MELPRRAFFQICLCLNWGIPVDSHVFAIARAGMWVLDGDTTETDAMKTLQQYWKRSQWYDINNELGGLGQLMDRGGEDMQCFFDSMMRLRAPTKQGYILLRRDLFVRD